MQLFRSSLRLKLGFWLLLLSLGPLITVAAITLAILLLQLLRLSAQLNEAEASLRTNVVGRTLTGAAADTVIDVDSYLLDRIDDVRRWSEEPFLIEAARQGTLAAIESGLGLAAGNPAALKAQMQDEIFLPIPNETFSPALSYVFHQVERQPIYVEILLTDAHGINILATRALEQVAHSDQTWWQEAARLDRAGIGFSNVFLDPAAQQPVIGIALPVIDPDTKRILGVLRALISLNDLQARLSQKAISYDAQIRIITREGLLVMDAGSGQSSALILEQNLLEQNYLPAQKALAAAPGVSGADFTAAGSELAGIAHTAGSEYYDRPALLSGFRGLEWGVMVVQPEARALQVLARLIDTGQALSRLPLQLGGLFGLITILAGGIALMGGILISGQISVPLVALSRQAQRIQQGDLTVRVEPRSSDEVGILERAFNQMTEGLRQRERERDVFGRVVSPEVREKLLSGALQLGGETRWVAVLFSDIRGFSTVSEQMTPQELVAFLNEYLTEMTSAIRPYGGYINNFIGDAIVAIFGAPLDTSDKEWNSVAAALSMRRKLEELNRRRAARGEAPIESGIGISTGEAVAGQIGSLERLLYTVIGDAVNVAARLEALTKEYPYAILINGSTAEALKNRTDILLHSLGPTLVKGRAEPVDLYAVEPKEL